MSTWKLAGMESDGYQGEADTLRESLLSKGIAWRRMESQPLKLSCYPIEMGTRYVIGVEYDTQRNEHSRYDTIFIADNLSCIKSYMNIADDRWQEFMEKSSRVAGWGGMTNHERIIAMHTWFFIADFDLADYIILADIEAGHITASISDKDIDQAIFCMVETLVTDADETGSSGKAMEVMMVAVEKRVREYMAAKQAVS